MGPSSITFTSAALTLPRFPLAVTTIPPLLPCCGLFFVLV